MAFHKTLLTVLVGAACVSACSGSDTPPSQSADNNMSFESPSQSPSQRLDIQCRNVQQATTEIGSAPLQLKKIGTYQSGAEFGAGASEIVTYDSCSDRLYVVNAANKTIDVLDLNDGKQAPTKIDTIDLNKAAKDAGIEIGAANSVSAAKGVVAVAIEASIKQENGIIALYRSDNLGLLNTFKAGALPDMVKLNKDATMVMSANEGEPSGDYKTDPEGSVTLVDLSQGVSDSSASVYTIDFKAFNQGQARHQELPDGVRISGPEGTSVAQDLEPEYIALAGKKAYVSLQENNAIAVIDLDQKRVASIVALGEKSWADEQLDASNKDKQIGNFKSYPQLAGLYMPDTVASFTFNGASYIVSANEGDGREYTYGEKESDCAAGHSWDDDEDYCISYTDEVRGKKVSVAEGHPLKEALADEKQLGRLKLIKIDGTANADQTLQAFGARSFSIWKIDGDNLSLTFDSGDTLAKTVFAQNSEYLNANSNNNSKKKADDRSDDKGVEPEAIEAVVIGERAFVFVGLERQGGVMAFDVTNSEKPVLQTYVAARDFSQDVCTEVKKGKCKNGEYNAKAGDLAPESIHYFSRQGAHFIAVGNEVSGTTSVYQLDFTAR